MPPATSESMEKSKTGTQPEMHTQPSNDANSYACPARWPYPLNFMYADNALNLCTFELQKWVWYQYELSRLYQEVQRRQEEFREKEVLLSQMRTLERGVKALAELVTKGMGEKLRIFTSG